MEDTPDKVSPPPISVEPEPEPDYSDEDEGKIKKIIAYTKNLRQNIIRLNNINDSLIEILNKQKVEIEDLKKGQRIRDSRLKHELINLKDEYCYKNNFYKISFLFIII